VPDVPEPDVPEPDVPEPDVPEPDDTGLPDSDDTGQPDDTGVPDTTVSAEIGLAEAALRSAVLAPGGLWSALDVVAQTGSTNEDLLAAARAGAAEGAVRVAERQTRGRGRQGRSWISPPGAALTFSVLLRPAVPPAERGWLPLLTGVALTRALQAATGVEVALKWPNDVLAGGAKLAGILAEQAGDAIVVGAGINVGAAQDELPAARAGALEPTSLALRGASATDRGALLVGILRELEHWYLRWTTAFLDAAASPGAADISGLRAEYLRWCSTIGRELRVQLPGGSELVGVASGIDRVGRLVVETAAGAVSVSAGDVIHVR
jgi:BirA family biotin operon repressor/biotin-[acetyl-CoA-carboxylase] ligase